MVAVILRNIIVGKIHWIDYVKGDTVTKIHIGKFHLNTKTKKRHNNFTETQNKNSVA